MKEGRREGRAVKAFMLLAAILVVFIAFAQLSGCLSKQTPEPKKSATVKVVESFNVDGMGITAWQENGIIAHYYYDFSIDFFLGHRWITLTYTNSKGREVWLRLNENDTVRSVKFLQKSYECADPENANLCKKAEEKVAYWKSIMKWDERVKRILEELKNRKPEEELD